MTVNLCIPEPNREALRAAVSHPNDSKSEVIIKAMISKWVLFTLLMLIPGQRFIGAHFSKS